MNYLFSCLNFVTFAISKDMEKCKKSSIIHNKEEGRRRLPLPPPLLATCRQGREECAGAAEENWIETIGEAKENGWHHEGGCSLWCQPFQLIIMYL